MADTTLNLPTRPGSAADTVPIKLADNGDGTYSLSVAGLASGADGTELDFSQAENSGHLVTVGL